MNKTYYDPSVVAVLNALGWEDWNPVPPSCPPLGSYDCIRNKKYPTMYFRGLNQARRGFAKPDEARFVIVCDHKDARFHDAIPSHTIDVRLKGWEKKCTRAVSTIAFSLYTLANKHMERDMRQVAIAKRKAVSRSELLAPHQIDEEDFRKVCDITYDYTTGEVAQVSTLRVTLQLDMSTGLDEATVRTIRTLIDWSKNRNGLAP